MNAAEQMQKITAAAEAVRSRLGGRRPQIAVILGSGLGGLAQRIDDPVVIPYSEIPGFPVSTVIGHKGQFVCGSLGGRQVLCMQGRFHYYEGYPLFDVTLPVRVMKLLGIRSLIVTNACGGINTSFKAGDLMLITDHLNLTGQNPLIGPNLDDLGPRFHDMTVAYDEEYRELALAKAKELSIGLKQGVYAWFTGPCYETSAEIRYARTIGADAAGMSTVPEVIVARHMGIRVLGISCVTNMAAGVLGKLLDHSEVTETASAVARNFEDLVTAIVSDL